jgi:hypothetical protein
MLNRRHPSSAWSDIRTQALNFFANQFVFIAIECAFVFACTLVRHALSRILHLVGPTGIDKLSLTGLEVIFTGSMLISVGYFVFFVHSRTVIKCVGLTDRKSSRIKLELSDSTSAQIAHLSDQSERTANADQPIFPAIAPVLSSAIRHQPDLPGSGYQPKFFRLYKPLRA